MSGENACACTWATNLTTGHVLFYCRTCNVEVSGPKAGVVADVIRHCPDIAERMPG